MAGAIKGVQSRIKEKNPCSVFSPCAAHTLNLVGVHAAGGKNSSHSVRTFFNCINQLYTFFSTSPENGRYCFDTLTSHFTDYWRLDGVPG